MKIFILAFLFLGSISTYAADQSGNVDLVYVHRDGVGDAVLFRLTGPMTGTTPSCSATGEWALSLSKPMGRATYAMLLMAQATGKSVTVRGLGTCYEWTQREEPYVAWMR